MRVHLSLTASQWRERLERLPAFARDVYFTPEYHALHAAEDGPAPWASAVEDGDRLLLVAGLRSPVGSDVPGARPSDWDLQTPNGYGGPLASLTANPTFLQTAWTEWARAMAEAGAVGAFFRLHPLVENHRWLAAPSFERPDRSTVFVDLGAGVESAWGAAEGRHRNMVRKARREAVLVDWQGQARDWADFRELYGAAMERAGAAPNLRFTEDYFDRLARLPGTALGVVRHGAEIVAGAVFLNGGVWSHYHLAARAPDAPSHLASLIVQEAVERAGREGRRGLHLGGGRTTDASDALLRFKSSLGGRRLEFRVARVVIQAEAFARLEEAWRAASGRTAAWLLPYRQPLSDAPSVAHRG